METETGWNDNVKQPALYLDVASWSYSVYARCVLGRRSVDVELRFHALYKLELQVERVYVFDCVVVGEQLQL